MSRGEQAAGWSGTRVLALVLLLSAGILVLSVTLRDWTVAVHHRPTHVAATSERDHRTDVAEPASWQVLQDPPTPCLTPDRAATCAVLAP